MRPELGPCDVQRKANAVFWLYPGIDNIKCLLYDAHQTFPTKWVA